MSTWKGIPKKFMQEVFQYGFSDYEQVEYDWEYGTVSDYLTINRKDSNGSTHMQFSKDEAKAMLSTIAQWYSRYEGKVQLKELLAEYLMEENEKAK